MASWNEVEQRWEYTDAELDEQFVEAEECGRGNGDRRAVAVSYDAVRGRVWVELEDGSAFAFPAEIAQGLRGARAEDLAQVELSPSGYGLHWPRLDADLLVEPLLLGIFGSKKWMAAMGRAGGAATSKAKTAASRANGKKGGRPRKPTTASP